jgi:hypothetical protein
MILDLGQCRGVSATIDLLSNGFGRVLLVGIGDVSGPRSVTGVFLSGWDRPSRSVRS